MKRLVKGFTRQLTSIAAPTWLRLRSTSLLILMYHRVLPGGHPDRQHEQAGMYVSPESLRMHIETLRRYFSLVHLDDWIRRKERGEGLPRLACALTFDDGWLDNHRFAFPVLREAAAPATVYLVSDLVGTTYAFWPNRLSQILGSPGGVRSFDGLPENFTKVLAAAGGSDGPMTTEQVDVVINQCKQLFTDAEMESMMAAANARQPSTAESNRDLMNWEEIREMHATGLVRFGSHSRRHTRLLGSIPDETVRDEVATSAELIEKNLGVRPTTFCYPNGDHSPVAVDIVRRHYAAATTTRRGWNSPDSDLHLLNRVGLHEDVSSTPAALLSRILGIG